MASVPWSSPSPTTSTAHDLAAAAARPRPAAGAVQRAAGRLAAGERGLACLPGREAEFRRALLDQALPYAQALRCPRVHVMAGVLPAGADRAAHRATYVANLAWAAAQAASAGIELLIEPINTARHSRLLPEPAGRGPCHRRRGRRAQPEGADGPVPLPDRRRRRGHEAAPVPAHRPRRPPADRRRARAPRARPRRAELPLPVRADRRTGLQRPHRLRIPAGGRHHRRAGLDGPLQDSETTHETAHHRRRRLRRRPPGAHAAGARHAGRPAHRPARAGRPGRAAGRPAGRRARQRARRPAARPVRGAGRRGLRRRLPPGLGGVGRMRGRLRPRPAHQPRQHARAARRAARAPAAPRRGHAAGVLQLGGGVRPRCGGADAAGRGRRHAAGAADQLRHAEAGVRAPDRRLHPQGLHRRPQRAADDGDGAAGPAQRRGLVVLQRHHPRAAGRRGVDLPGVAEVRTRCRRRAARWKG